MPQTTLPVDRKLARAEAAQLRQLEDVLATARRWAMEEAKALYEIQQRRLYRAEFDTFEDYVSERWGYDRTHAYRIAQWGATLSVLSPIGDNDELPQREAHARPLYGLTQGQQIKAWRIARKTRAISAAVVEDAVASVLRPAKSQPTPAGHTTGKIVCGDAMKMLPTLADGAVDLLLTSPPYCEQRKAHYPSIPEAEYPSWICSLLEAARPKMKPDGNVLLVARAHLRNGQISDTWLRTRLALREAGWIECETLIWSKPDQPPLGRADRPRRAFEYIYWFSRTSNPAVDVRACGTTMIESRSRMNRPKEKAIHNGGQLFRRFRGDCGARITDIITATVGGVSSGIAHPAMMPQLLADQLVKTFSPATGLVIDPCCGSGTTLLAARDSGRHWWGCDCVPQYVRIAQNRLTVR